MNLLFLNVTDNSLAELNGDEVEFYLDAKGDVYAFLQQCYANYSCMNRREDVICNAYSDSGSNDAATLNKRKLDIICDKVIGRYK